MLAVVVLLLTAEFAHAAFKMQQAPVLHSVFDKALACDYPPIDNPGRRAWWAPPPQRHLPKLYDSENKRVSLPSMANNERKGTALIVAGGICLLAGIPSLAYGYAHNNDQPRSGWYSSNSLQAIDVLVAFGIVAIVAGLTLLFSGIAVRRHFRIDD